MYKTKFFIFFHFASKIELLVVIYRVHSLDNNASMVYFSSGFA